MNFEHELIFTATEIAEILKVKRDCVIDLINFGYLRSTKLQGNKITKDALMEFIKKYDGTDIEGEIHRKSEDI